MLLLVAAKQSKAKVQNNGKRHSQQFEIEVSRMEGCRQVNSHAKTPTRGHSFQLPRAGEAVAKQESCK
jgi:hypothetical protein